MAFVLVGVLSYEPVQYVSGDHRQADVPTRRIALVLVQPSALREFGAEGCARTPTPSAAHHSSGDLFRPVTTSVMSATRRPRSRA